MYSRANQIQTWRSAGVDHETSLIPTFIWLHLPKYEIIKISHIESIPIYTNTIEADYFSYVFIFDLSLKLLSRPLIFVEMGLFAAYLLFYFF